MSAPVCPTVEKVSVRHCGRWAIAALLAASACAERASPSSAERSAAPVPSVAASQTAPPPVVASPLTRGFSLGEQYRYTIKLSTAVRFVAEQASFDFDLLGDLELRVIRVAPEAATLYAAMHGARVVNRVPATRAELDELVAELRSKGAFFTLAGGRASELMVPPGTSAMAASTYRQVGAALQFVHAEPGTQQYTADEYDTTGLYVAEYSLGADGKLWNKRKQRYTALLGPAAQAPSASSVVPKIARSTGEVRLDASGRPVSVKLADELVVDHAHLPVRSRIAIELQSVPAKPPAIEPDFAALLSRARRYAASDAILEGPSEAALDDARIGTLDFPTIVRQLEILLRSQKPIEVKPDGASPVPTPEEEAAQQSTLQQQAQLFGALTATFRKDPHTIARATAKIRAGSPVSDALVDALGSASTPGTHRALAELLGSTAMDTEARGRIILALARVQKPTPEATLALLGVLEKEPFQAGALYGIGSHARLLRDAGQLDDAKRLGEVLLQRLADAKGAPALGTVLRAIANSGYDAALPRVLPFLGDEREEIRSAALWAMQSMRDPRVDELIATRLVADESKQVRLAALDAARVRKPTDVLVRALTGIGATASDAHVRYQAVELMLRWLPERPDFRPALEHIARNDAETRVRERALAGL